MQLKWGRTRGPTIEIYAWLLAFITCWIIDAILLVITDKLTDHLKLDSFGWALAGALLMSLVGTLGE